MPQFRKRPILIDAERFEPKGIFDGLSWRPYWEPYVVLDVVRLRAWPWFWRARYAIRTAEGLMDLHIGDWIITGIAGEHYPCKPAIFEAKYDPIIKETTDATA